MMSIGEVSSLLGAFLNHPDFERLKAETPKLQSLIKQIQELLGKTKIDEETEQAFREFAKICEEGLK